MRTSRRKTVAMRSPSSNPILQEKDHAGGTITFHAIPPNTFTTPSLQSLIYATSNDRYPGAPGTSLHRAKLEAAKAVAASKREIQKELERREEMKRLGILGVGKKRVVGGAAAAAANGNGHESGSTASNGGNSRYSTPGPGSERIRRGQAAAAASNGTQHAPNATSSSSLATANTRQPRSNGRNIANAIDHNSLPTPLNAATAGPGSPLLTSSGRIRRPASASRGASPLPLTSQAAAHTNGTINSRTRSPIVAPIDLRSTDSTGRGETGSSLGMTAVG